MDKFVINDLSVRYSDGVESLRHVSFNIPANAITTLIGPGGSGKSTLLRCLNRLNDLADVDTITGQVLFNGMDVLAPDVDVIALRRKIGVVFSRPVPLPLSIYENITYSLVMGGERSKAKLDDAVERSLHLAELWDEVHDRLHDPGTAISGGQQQRLCLARVLALQPEVILLDEPTSALDPISTAKIEGKLQELKSEYTIIIAPHNIQQAARLADHAVFLLQGELIEVGAGKDLFSRPRDSRTQDYVTGRFG